MASGGIFQELSSRLATAHDEEPDGSSEDALSKKSPPKKPPPPQKPTNDKIRSNTAAKGKTVRISIDANEEKRQTIGPMTSDSTEEENESPKKKQGVWKGIKRFFGKKKDRRSMRDGNKKKSSKDEMLSNQLRAKSESELSTCDKKNTGKGKDDKLKNSRFSWSEGLENADDSRGNELRRGGGSPSDEEANNEKSGGGLQKIRDSFRNRFKLKKKRSDGGSESCDSSVTSEKPTSYFDLDTNFFDDSFYTARLSTDNETPLPQPDNIPDDFPPSIELSSLSTSNAARHKINIAPKSRRKPARFRQKEGTSSSDIEIKTNESTVDNVPTGALKPVKEQISEGKTSDENISLITKLHKGHIDQTNDNNADHFEDKGTSSSLEQIPVKEIKRPIPAPRPRPKSLGPGLLIDEKSAKQEPIAVEITVTKSPDIKRKVLPEIPKSKSTGDVQIIDSPREPDNIPETTSMEMITINEDLPSGSADIVGFNSAAGTPQSISSDWEHINDVDSPVNTSRSSLNVDKLDGIDSQPTLTQQTLTNSSPDHSGGENTYEESSRINVTAMENKTQVTDSNNGVIESSKIDEDDISVSDLSKDNELTKKRLPPNTSVFKVSSPKLQHAAEVAAIRANRAANAETGNTPASPIYDKPFTFQKRQWSSMKSKKSEMIDLRSVDIEEETQPSRSYSVSSRQSNSVKSRSFENPVSDKEEVTPGKELPDWIKIARLKHQKRLGNDAVDDEDETKNLSNENLNHHQERKAKLQRLQHLVIDLDKIIL